MAIKFPLEMKDGVQVRNITDLKENFDVEKVVGYFLDGKLKSWLEARYYEEEAEAVVKLEGNDPELASKLCKIFDIEYRCDKEINREELARRNERMAKLKQFTDDAEILANVDNVAFDQEELADLYDKGIKKIYLCEGEFFIPKSKQNLEYILIDEPEVEGLKKDDRKSGKDANKEMYDERKSSSVHGKCKADYIFDKLADVIGWNDYVVADDYVVFSNGLDFFADNLPPLNTDENYTEEEGYFRVWDIRREKLSSFKLNGYDDYKKLVAATGNKVVLTKSWGKDVIVYDIEDKSIKLTCENWSGVIHEISVSNGKIAYIDENRNLYYVDLNSYERIFVENLDVDLTEENPFMLFFAPIRASLESLNGNYILLQETSVLYVKRKKIFKYDFLNKQTKVIADLNISVSELLLHDERLYIIGHEWSDNKFVIYELNLKDSKNNLKEVFRTDVRAGETKTVKKESYYVLLKEELGYPVYVFNAKLGTMKKILSNCRYIFCVVGNYFFYDKSTNFDKNYFRINMLTGEHISQEKRTKN